MTVRADGRPPGENGENTVWLLSDNAVLSAALQAALTVAGWQAVRWLSVGSLAEAAQDSGRLGPLILVADGGGSLPDPRPALAGRISPLVVAVGTREAFAALAEAVERRIAMAVVDADQPFTDLVDALDRLLRLDSFRPDHARLAARLRRREAEARRFADLTRREQEVLAGLLAGRSAAEIAAAGAVSLATVRSHIRAVLTKLGVSSQVAAVALAQRSCRERGVLERMRQVHQF